MLNERGKLTRVDVGQTKAAEVRRTSGGDILYNRRKGFIGAEWLATEALQPGVDRGDDRGIGAGALDDETDEGLCVEARGVRR